VLAIAGVVVAVARVASPDRRRADVGVVLGAAIKVAPAGVGRVAGGVQLTGGGALLGRAAQARHAALVGGAAAVRRRARRADAAVAVGLLAVRALALPG